MSAWEELKGLFISKTPQRFYASIESDHVIPPDKYVPFEPEGTYLKIWLNDMYLANKRVLYQTSIPIVHASCSFLHQGKVEVVPVIVCSGQIKELKVDYLGDVINLNYRIIGPIPFNGGDVEILLALFAVQTASYADQFLNVLGTLSSLTCQGELKIALQFIKPLKDGLEGLFGLKKFAPHIGIHDTFSLGDAAPSRLSPGYRVVINVPAENMRGKKLWVVNGRLLCGESLDKAKTFKDADYILFKIEPLKERDDWSYLASIKEAWDEAIREATKGEEKEIQNAFETFRGIVLNSPDLIWSDKVRLVDALRMRLDQISEMRKPKRVVRGVQPSRPTVPVPDGTDIKTSLSKAISIEDAKKRTKEEVLGVSWK